MTPVYDLAIVGSGFAGSLLAMIARRCGRSVLLLEKGKHPRFAMGESSTPLANLLLEELADRYDLPRLKPLCKWGSWQRTYPELACGLKRGFSFYHHAGGKPGTAGFTREEQLLVAASPHDEIADTHWYRSDFDHFLQREAHRMGADYVDQVDLQHVIEFPDSIELTGRRFADPIRVRTKFLIDATGPRGFIHRALNLEEQPFLDYPRTQALYTHFHDVARFGDATQPTPYPIDDAALHHVFEGGWMWVLRFNNGLTSAGVAATEAVANQLRLSEGAPAWDRLLDRLPAVNPQFAHARPERAFTYVPQLSFLSSAVTGPRWALLPSAAAFVDPLFSTGFPLSLLGIARIAEVLQQDWPSELLESYAVRTRNESEAAARLVGALYSTMNNFPLFTSLSMLYFSAATFAETARRLGQYHLAPSFLLCDQPVFGPQFVKLCYAANHAQPGRESVDLNARILRAIEPFNVAGLGDAQRNNWYPVNTDDLFRNAGKLGVGQAAIANLLNKCGF